MKPEHKTLKTRLMICEIFYSDAEPMSKSEVELRLDEEELVIAYEDEDDLGRPLTVIYRGTNRGDGHYELRATGVDGRATLHRNPDHDVFEGTWIEGGSMGMWRINPIP